MTTIDVLEYPVTYLSNVGPARAKLLKEGMGVRTYGDLLMQFPTKHIDRSRFYYTHELSPDMPYVQLKGQILSFEEEGQGRKRRIVGHFSDGNGVVDLVWFNGLQYIERSYHILTDYVVFGKPSVFKGRINITHPELTDLSAWKQMYQNGNDSAPILRPYYSVPEKLQKHGINSKMMEQWVETVFRLMHEPVKETLPQYLLDELHLMSRHQAIRAMHRPQSASEVTQATYRLKFEELFFIQLNILRYSRQRNLRYAGYVFDRVGMLFNQFYYNYLPFPLTEAQKRVIRQMREDMRSGRQMNRLLQGDVGSGKTIVALMTMLIAIGCGHQACLMAPTEILAEQHLATFRHLLAQMHVRVELLTSAVKGKRRNEIMEGLKDGSVNILIGTHAIIEDAVQFYSLGFVIIDEQHRFGVAQRAKLWQKAQVTGTGNQPLLPHVLVMTATPIPRTLAMTVYGDLDVSVIDELPPGRKPVQTIHHYENRRQQLYDGLRQQISQGRQAYIVYPLIKESEKMDLQNLEQGYNEFVKAFPDLRISMVHGKMKPAEKDSEMDRFVRGETQILMATTVIEVGVNVPNATVMAIMNAERFGLAQLHQLRGRVGRGADQSYCILVTAFKLSSDTKRRIQIMCETNDGFEIAEEDMKLRGPGDLEGTMQSGIPFDLHIANLARDGQLVQQARDYARRLLDSDPQANLPENANTWAQLANLNRDSVDWSAIS